MRVSCLKRNDILSLLNKCKRLYCDSFMLFLKPNDKLQLTISVSASYGKSHERNLVKRRIYSLIHGKYSNVMLWFRINNKHKNHSDFTTLESQIEKLINNYRKID